jgi:NNP family nitrate/nitrite transporter-like MFS transporter
VGLSSFLPIFLRDQYHVTPVTAGYLTALAAFTGSGLRPLGGWLADKVGGVRMLLVLFVCIASLYAMIAQLPALPLMMTLMVACVASLGLGNGAVFQLVPQRFQLEIGIATGVVGAVGGLGGFFLPTLLGNVKQATGSFGAGLLVLSGVAFGAVALLVLLTVRDEGWRLSWRVPQPAEAMEEA